jgi:predicted glycosyltransferase
VLTGRRRIIGVMTVAVPVRDDLTRERLVAAASHLPGLQVLTFHADWWDGQAHAPCLVIRGGRGSRLLRIVETCGECVIVPFSRRTAERWLAARRRPRRPELSVPDQRRPDDLVVEVTADVLRCTSAGCGALLPLDHDGACPVCTTPLPG